jgi:hypothetical protein
MVVRCTRACLVLARSYHPRLVLAPRFLASLLHVVYHKYASMKQQHKCNAWGANSGILHAHAQLTHVNPYKSFTNLPLAFSVFSNLTIA